MQHWLTRVAPDEYDCALARTPDVCRPFAAAMGDRRSAHRCVADGPADAARTLVSGEVAPYSVVGGNPMRHLRWRFSEPIREQLLKIKWWDWNLDKLKQHLTLIRSSEVEVLWSKYQDGLL